MSAADIVVLTGGVGGAKLALGLYRTQRADALAFIVNTGDDFEHLGLQICPDLDTTLYTLAGLADPQRGWGRREETWNCMCALEALGGPAWFGLGDADLALHVLRTHRLRAGEPLSAVTAFFARTLGIESRVLPMSDHPIRTTLDTDAGVLPFQDYFVRLKCEPRVRSVQFAGAEDARASAGMLEAISSASVVILAPSNPYLSIDPILAVPGVRYALRRTSAPVVAVTPIVGGEAIKGPTAKMMREQNIAPTPLAVARHYRDFLDGFVLDAADAELAAQISIPARVTHTVMHDLESRMRLAREVVEFASELARPPARNPKAVA